jgi:small-conductance mechanosensitive channel
MSNYLEFELFSLGKSTVQVSTIIMLVVVIFIAIITKFIIKKGIYRIKDIDISKKYAMFKLTQYILWVVVILFILQILKINISVLLAGSAALLVGIGLGMQQVFADFVSGIFLLLDRAIKVGDIIEVKGMICRVQEIKFRTTIVIGRDENYIILPNSVLTKNEVINWTHNQVASRFKIEVGVDYSSDVELVMKVLAETTRMHSKVLKDHDVSVRFHDYADSSLVFIVLFWSEEIFRIENIKSQIRVEIFKAFKENNIHIPFPQRVVHKPSSESTDQAT